MKHYRNNANIRLTFGSLKKEIPAGQIREFSDKELENERFVRDVKLYTEAGYLEEVDNNAKPIVFEPSKPGIPPVIVPKDVKPQEMGQVVLPQGLTQESEGQVVVAGAKSMPGQGESKPMGEFISGQVKKAGKVIEHATEGKTPVGEVKKKKKRQAPQI